MLAAGPGNEYQYDVRGLDSAGAQTVRGEAVATRAVMLSSCRGSCQPKSTTNFWQTGSLWFADSGGSHRSHMTQYTAWQMSSQTSLGKMCFSGLGDL